jgi:hypothetical protein
LETTGGMMAWPCQKCRILSFAATDYTLHEPQSPSLEILDTLEILVGNEILAAFSFPPNCDRLRA